MIVRWGLDELDGLLAEVGIERPLVVASDRWSDLLLPARRRWSEVPTDRIVDVAAAAEGADGLLAVGGGSAIDLAKAVSAETGLPLVSVPTTYSGAEWTEFFGVRDPDRRMQGGGAGAHLAGIVYEPRLTLDLPRDQTGGTALNALAHCAEALYVAGHNPEGDREALAGAQADRRVAAAGARRRPRPRGPHPAARGRAARRRRARLGGAGARPRDGAGARRPLRDRRTARRMRSASRRRCASTSPSRRRRSHASARRSASPTRPPGSRSSPARPASRASVSSAFPRTSSTRSPTAVVQRAGAKANPRPASPDQVAELLRSIW